MKHTTTFEKFNEKNKQSLNEKLEGDEWKLWIDIEDAIRSLYIKYKNKVEPGKISEFIQEQADAYKTVGPKLK